MALALIDEEEVRNGERWFRFEIGSNRYWRVAVGGSERRRRYGVPLILDPTWISALDGPLPEAAIGRGRLSIPEEVFDREDQFVQLMSYRTADGVGPSVSPIVRSSGASLESLPTLASFSVSASRVPLPATQEAPRPMRYRVAPLSEAMFLQGLLSALPSILPTVGNLVGGLFGGGGGGGGARPAAGGGGILAELTNPETMRAIAEILQQVAAGSAGAPTTSAANATPAAQALGRARDARLRRPLSEAQIAPAALLPLLSTLMPALQQVLNPQTVQAVLEAPNRHTQTMLNGLRDFARLGIESHEQDLRHLRELNPGVDDPALEQLLASMSLSLSQPRGGTRYRRSEKVKLALESPPTHQLFGQTRVLYVHGAAMRFPLQVTLPVLGSGRTPTLQTTRLELLVKDADTLSVQIQKRWSPGEISESGAVVPTPELSADESSSLVPDKDYIACFALLWKNRRNETLGAPIQQRVRVAPALMFDRVESEDAAIELSDLDRYREYWHRVWAERFNDESKRFEIQASYVTVLPGNGISQNARLETKVKRRRKEHSLHTVQVRMKSGMEYALPALNRLLPILAPQRPELTSDELEALAHPDFAERFNQAGQAAVNLRGRAGQSCALWAYPTMKIMRVMLKSVEQTDENGAVLSLGDRSVYFPIPGKVHFIGTRSS